MRVWLIWMRRKELSQEFVRKVVDRTVVDAWRALRGRNRHPEVFFDSNAVERNHPLSYDPTLPEDSEALQFLLGKLLPSERVIVQHMAKGFGPGELAKEFGCHRVTMSRRINRIMEKLKRYTWVL